MRKSEQTEENAVFELLNYNANARSKGLCCIKNNVNPNRLYERGQGKICIIVLLLWFLDMYSGKLTNHEIIGYNPDDYFQNYLFN